MASSRARPSTGPRSLTILLGGLLGLLILTLTLSPADTTGPPVAGLGSPAVEAAEWAAREGLLEPIWTGDPTPVDLLGAAGDLDRVGSPAARPR